MTSLVDLTIGGHGTHEWYLVFKNNAQSHSRNTVHLYNNKCFVRVISVALARIWACDSSLEPSCYKNDQVMGENRFAHALRPQCAKMRFLLYRALLNGHFKAYIAKKNCR